MYLIDNFYFQSVKAAVFKKKYFEDFEKFEITKGEILIKEGDCPDSLYFIREGELEISINQTLLQLNQLIHILENKLGKVAEKSDLKSGMMLIY